MNERTNELASRVNEWTSGWVDEWTSERVSERVSMIHTLVFKLELWGNTMDLIIWVVYIMTLVTITVLSTPSSDGRVMHHVENASRGDWFIKF